MIFNSFSNSKVKTMRNCVSCGQDGVFIPREEFNRGLFLDETKKIALQQKIMENDKLIQSLKEDLDILKEGDV